MALGIQFLTLEDFLFWLALGICCIALFIVILYYFLRRAVKKWMNNFKERIEEVAESGQKVGTTTASAPQLPSNPAEEILVKKYGDVPRGKPLGETWRKRVDFSEVTLTPVDGQEIEMGGIIFRFKDTSKLGFKVADELEEAMKAKEGTESPKEEKKSDYEVLPPIVNAAKAIEASETI